MEGKLGLVAGSHNCNEFIIFNPDANFSRREEKEERGKECKICGDEIGINEEGEVFVACNECAFPVCRNCYEYERREGSHVCPQCKTRYKRLKGSARVDGDEDEDDIDDLENEFDFNEETRQQDMQLHGYSQDEDDERVGEGHNNNNAIEPSSMGNKVISIQARPMDPSKDLAAYGYGSVAWKERMEIWRQRQEKMRLMRIDNNTTHEEYQDSFADDDGINFPLMDEARQALSRKMAIPSSKINPYRIMIIIRMVILGFFFHYRVTHPVDNAFALWLVAVVCELWFALSWILDQFPKWFPVQRETYLDRLTLRYEKDGEASQLCGIDIFVTTLDPLKEPPLVTANTILSILAVDYPPEKVSCFVSDDGAAMLTFETLSETSEFARKWVPFCKKFNIEPRAPEWYFAEKVNYLKDKAHPSFVKERRAMKREYEEFKVRINSLVAKARNVPEEGWTMQDGTIWPGNNVDDHPGMIQVFLGQYGGHDTDGNELPRLVYVSREKRPKFKHHMKAGALNALVRVSAVLSNAPCLLNLDYDHYINNSKAIREAMCFMMDPLQEKRVCYVQFSHRFGGADDNDKYNSPSTSFLDINMKGMDGIQGPIYVGTGCVFKRHTLYGYDAPRKKKTPTKTCNCWPKWCCCLCFCLRNKKKKSKNSRFDFEDSSKTKVHDAEISMKGYALTRIEQGNKGVEGQVLGEKYKPKLWKKFGQSPVLIASTILENGETVKDASLASLLKEAIHVISCSYEEKTEWGKEVGWIYGSTTEDILTGFKMHCHGWRSIYCIPERPAFKVSVPRNLSDGLVQVFKWALGSTEIFLSKHCPIWYGYRGGLKWLERISYINATIYPWTSIPLVAYCSLPTVCLLTGKFIVPQLNNFDGMWFLSLFICIFSTSILEMRWSGVPIDEWWRNEQLWVIEGVSANLFALFLGLFKVITGIDTKFIVKSKASDEEEGKDFAGIFALNWTTLLIIPTTLLILNLIAIVAGVSHAINDGFESWGPFLGKLLFASWVICHLYPFLKGMMGRKNRTPTIVLVWSILLASFFSVLWVKIDPFLPKSSGPILEECGLDCD
ncbi:hypothetical protein QN277_009301 [Acacia crassicarpa]|uniref:Cellulose synthase n=1 Tax=Acacia crassicarpa TaxID=499986 RepID=A0AAE1IS85_9FABA|nr:hypothetical protein QN277_009301 [Acacia crassicarpa]